jgi:exodeoxyribonuclease-5
VPWEETGHGIVVVRNERGQRVTLGNAWFEEFSHEVRSDRTNQAHPFTFGYAATVHKYQGSEADNVILYDDYRSPRGHREWLYTGVTRAARSITVVPLQ